MDRAGQHFIEWRAIRMTRLRLHGLRCLAYALLVLALLPCIAEFAFRISAIQAEIQATSERPRWQLVPSVASHHQLAPLQTVRNSPTETTEAVSFKINSFGLRGPEIVLPKPAETLRIVCLGDETIFAASVSDEVLFGARLKAHLQPYTQQVIEVINAGLPDSCPLLSYLQLKHQLLALQADVLIAHFDPSDIADDAKYRRLTDLDSNEVPLVCIHPSLTSTPKIKPLCEHFLCVQWLKREVTGQFGLRDDNILNDVGNAVKRDWKRDLSFANPEQFKSTLRPIDQMSRLTIGLGCRTILAIHPLVDQLVAEASTSQPNEVHAAAEMTSEGVTSARVLHEFEKSSSSRACHIANTLRRVKNPEAAFEDDHRTLTKFGHDIYAYALAETLFEVIPEAWTTPNTNASPAEARGRSQQTSHTESSHSRPSQIQRPTTASESVPDADVNRY